MRKQQELARLKATSHKAQIDQLQHELNLVNEEYISIKTKKEQLGHMLSSKANRKEDIIKGIQEITKSLDETKPLLVKTEKDFREIKASIEALEESAKKENELLSGRSQSFNEKNIVYHQKQNRVSGIQREIEFKQSAFESSKSRIDKNHTELDKNETEIKRLVESTSSNDNQLISMYDEKESIEKGVNEAEKDYYAQRGNIDVADKTLRELQRKKEASDSFIMEMQNKLNDTKLELNSVKERLSVEFNVNLDELIKNQEEEFSEALDLTELEELVLSKRDKIERMGPINPMAMEAYDEIKERHSFISEQKQDLEEAKGSLLETISEIDTVAKQTFLDAFGNIKENFIKVFRSLFTEEDDCDLRLVDPDNPLESAIEIMAKPKGKRPLTINQLSGGEKTLTATSLLFSIYLLKPAPFCIFDEVDAPLDDANIDKFNNIIQKFSSDSQFIIVTHNKRTMAATDIIYGITMIEQGISRVVPVDLRELED